MSHDQVRKNCKKRSCDECDAIERAHTLALTPSYYYVRAPSTEPELPYVKFPDGRWHAPSNCRCNLCEQEARIVALWEAIRAHP